MSLHMLHHVLQPGNAMLGPYMLVQGKRALGLHAGHPKKVEQQWAAIVQHFTDRVHIQLVEKDGH
jgi:hypothetical protein